MLDKNCNILFVIYFIPKYNYYYYSYDVLYHRGNKNAFYLDLNYMIQVKYLINLSVTFYCSSPAFHYFPMSSLCSVFSIVCSRLGYTRLCKYISRGI